MKYTLNTFVKEIFEAGDLGSTRSYNVCLYAGFETLKSLLEYYCSGESFLNLRNSGRKSQEELQAFCECMMGSEHFVYNREIGEVMAYLSEQEKNRISELHQLFDAFCEEQDISFTSMLDICLQDASFSSLNISNVFKEYTTWKRLLDLYVVAMESSEELSALLAVSFESLENYWAGKESAGFIRDYLSLSKTKYKCLDYFYLDCLDKCSSRTKNALFAHCELDLFLQSYFKRNAFLKLANIGIQSLEEIKGIFDAVVDRLGALIGEDEEYVYIRNVIYKYPFAENLEAELLEYYRKYHRLPFLRIFQSYFQYTADKNELIFCRYNGFFGEPMSREDLGKAFDCTVERIRQVTVKCFDALTENALYQEDWRIYAGLMEGLVIAEDTVFVQEIKENERLMLSDRSLLLLLSGVGDAGFSYFHPLKTFTSSGRAYLIKKELSEVFDFASFIRLFVERMALVERVENESVCIRNLVMNSTFWKVRFLKTKLDVVVETIVLLLEKELNLEHESSRTVLLPKNAEKSGDTLVYEILREKGHPMHLSEILQRLTELAPGHRIKTDNQLRPVLFVNADFVPLGKTSTYALKEWGMKSGTIKDLAYEFVSKSDVPVAFEDIANYVQMYHPGNSRNSIWANLCYYASDMFVYFGNNMFGIFEKDYGVGHEAAICHGDWVQKSFSERMADLKAFVSCNKRFPFSNNVPKEEIFLYGWYRRPSVKSNQDFISFLEANKHLVYDKTVWDNLRKLDELKDFVSQNYCLPTSKHPLYTVWRRNVQNELECKLNEEGRQLMSDIRVLLERKPGYRDLFTDLQ